VSSNIFKIALALAGIASVARADSFSVSVEIAGPANIFGAGGNAGGTPSPGGGVVDFGGNYGGVAPIEILFPFDLDYLVVDSVTGTINCCAGRPPFMEVGADGSTLASTDLNSVGSISGIKVPNHILFLAGVFLGPSLPDEAPPVLTFDTADFLTLAPQLGQTFYIGDGRVGYNDPNGTQQVFYVPEGATRLFLGFGDGRRFTGDPGYYNDNYGLLAGTFTGTVVPEPQTYALVGLLLAGVAGYRRRVFKSQN
jgi:hypothetical protein